MSAHSAPAANSPLKAEGDSDSSDYVSVVNVSGPSRHASLLVDVGSASGETPVRPTTTRVKRRPADLTSGLRDASRVLALDNALLRIAEVELEMRVVKEAAEARAARAIRLPATNFRERAQYCYADSCNLLGDLFDNKCFRLVVFVVIVLLLLGIGNELRLRLLVDANAPSGMSFAADGLGDPEDDLGVPLPADFQ